MSGGDHGPGFEYLRMDKRQNARDIEEEKIFLVEQADAKKRAAQVAKVEQAQRKLDEMTRDHENKSLGMARTFSKHEDESEEVWLKRERTNAIRTWLGDIREDLSGVRRPNDNRSVIVFEILYKRWARLGRPAEGVTFSFEVLKESTKLSERVLYREVKALVDKGILKREQIGRRGGRGGRATVCYSFPTFPDQSAPDD
jgi:hypothetical protein